MLLRGTPAENLQRRVSASNWNIFIATTSYPDVFPCFRRTCKLINKTSTLNWHSRLRSGTNWMKPYSTQGRSKLLQMIQSKTRLCRFLQIKTQPWRARISHSNQIKLRLTFLYFIIPLLTNKLETECFSRMQMVLLLVRSTLNKYLHQLICMRLDALLLASSNRSKGQSPTKWPRCFNRMISCRANSN